MTLSNTIKSLVLLAGAVLIINIMTSCGSNSPIEPIQSDNPIGISAVGPSGTHNLQGIWDFAIEPGIGIVDAIPCRTSEAHYDITKIALSPKMCPGCIAFKFGNINNGGQQDVTVTVTNNYKGKIAGYDLKGIILADQSIDSTSPYESPWYLLNADNYTNLGTSPIQSETRNPFKAFCPTDTQRKLAYGNSTTLIFKLMFPPSPVDWSKITVGWALDACDSNCPEPYAIDNQSVNGGIIPVLGEKEEVSLNARDHQSNVASVVIDAETIGGGGGGGGGGAISLTKVSGDLWSGDISASDDTVPGDYTLEITAADSIEKNVKIFDEFEVSVGISISQSAVYDKITGIIDDWDTDLIDCITDQFAEAVGGDSDDLKDLITGYVSDIGVLLSGGSSGDTLKYNVLKRTKVFVSDLDDLGIDITMSGLVNALRDALDSCLNGSWGWSGNNYNLNAGACSLDIGVIGGGALQGNILYSSNSPNCNQIWKYTSNYANTGLYKSLVNLDPANPLFQPWPVARLDATNDGAFSWSNQNYDYYIDPAYGNLPIRISSIWCTDDKIPSFHNVPVDDSRIFPVPPPPPVSGFTPADVCNDFDNLQYALFVDPTMMVQPHVWGLKGAAQGKDYTKSDDRYGAFFNWAMVGPGDGQIEAGVGDIAGIDVWNKTDTKAWLSVAEKGAQWAVEVFEITDKGAGLGVDTLTWVYTIHFNTQPLDIELIPTNPDYEKNTDVPTIAVLLRSNDGTGYISLNRADNGVLIETIGTSATGCFSSMPSYLDVNDGAYEIHVTRSGPVATIFKLTFNPGT